MTSTERASLPQDPSRAILVLGMHRSGTSAVTRVLNLLGAGLGTRLMPPMPNNNDKGFWESAEAVEIDERLLGQIGRSWHDVRPMPDGWLDSPAASHAHAAIAAFMRAEFADSALWAVKDPRLCRLVPVWLRALADRGVEPGVVCVVRHPLEIAASLHARDRLSRSHALLLWTRHVLEAERATRGCRRVMVTYEQILTDWSGTMTRVSQALAVTWARSFEEARPEIETFLDVGDRHHTITTATFPDGSVEPESLPGLVTEIFRQCVQVSEVDGDWSALRECAEELEARIDELVDAGPASEERPQRAAATLAHTAPHAVTLPWLSGQMERALEMLTARSGEIEDLKQRLSQQAADLEQLKLSLREQAASVVRLTTSVDAHSAYLEAPADLLACQADIGALRQEISALRERRIGAAIQRGLRRLWTPRAGDGPRYGTAGVLLRAFYHRLPLSERGRQVLKDRSFLVLAPLIRETGAYKRWDAMRAHRSSDVSIPAEPATGPSAVAQYLTDLWQHAERWNEPDYVELMPLAPPSGQVSAKLIAFYLPQYHPVPENDAWWGKGFTEWSNVSRGVPQFVGHYQPRLPGELGFYDLRLGDVMRRQVELARTYGIHAFCFYYYWFGGRRLLELPLEQYVGSPIDFPFCICWTNENWTRRWDGFDDDVLIAQRYLPEDDLAFIRDVEPLLRDPRYVRIGGKPLLIVYRPSSMPDATRTLARWREYWRDSGLGELFVVMAQFDVEDPRTYGFDAAIEFPPHKLARGLAPINASLDIINPHYAGFVNDYRALIERARGLPEPDYPLFRGVFPSWDNEARQPGRGYTFAFSSPARYREWLRLAIDYARRRPVASERMVFINAWNEWAEGAYLEPDRRYGYAYLQATREAITVDAETSDDAGITVVSHDAHPHGAQYLALHMTRSLTRTFARRVEVVLLGPGPLDPEFAEAATVHRLDGRDPAGEEAVALARSMAARGIRLAIVNTTASGLFVAALKAAGIRVIGLVHELPGVIEQHRLQAHAHALAEHADVVVFPADPVREAFRRYATLDEARVRIRPQGVLKHNRFASPGERSDARRRLRERLGIASDARIVLCVGYADHRKGVDFFVEVAARVMRHDPRAHFVWLGHFDISVEIDIRRAASATGFAARIFFLDRDPNTDVYYAGADVYALTSREDPFPGVLLEALQSGLPVVGFEAAGGFLPLLRRCGRLVPAFDIGAFAREIRALLDDRRAAEACGASGRELIRHDYSLRAYLFELLEQGGMAPPRVSVVVPNYNYASYLPGRLASICRQHLPVFEVIVLDDASTDESIEVVDRLEGELGVAIRVVQNERNSGSVFRQWSRGVELARGDYVWIAEADDLSDARFLQTVMPALTDPKVVLSYCQSKQIDASGRLLAETYLDYTADVSSDHWRDAYTVDGKDEVARFLAVKNTIPNVSAVVFRREAIGAALAEAAEDVLSYRSAGDWRVYVTLLRYGHVAFQPESLNLHRRHAGSVTIGSDQLPHLLEILRMQKYVRDQFDVDEATRAVAHRYAQTLYEYFGLATPAHPRVDMNDQAGPFLR